MAAHAKMVAAESSGSNQWDEIHVPGGPILKVHMSTYTLIEFSIFSLFTQEIHSAFCPLVQQFTIIITQFRERILLWENCLRCRVDKAQELRVFVMSVGKNLIGLNQNFVLNVEPKDKVCE